MKKITSMLMALLATSSMTVAAQTIKFATEATYPPFEFINAAGQIQGFDVDIANALCKQMKAECTFTNQAFNSLIPSLKIGKFDALIATLGVTEERAKQVDFSNSYYEPSASFVAPLDKKYTLQTLNGKTVGTQEGSTFVKYLEDQYKGKLTVKTYASVQDAFLDLSSGRIDMVLTDTPIVKNWLMQDKNNQQFGIVDKPIVDHSYFGAGYAIAVRKGDQQLLNAINKALAEIKANGVYAGIVKKYFNG